MSLPSVSWTPSHAPSESRMPSISPSEEPSNAPSMAKKISSTIASTSCGKAGGETRKRSDKAKGGESHDHAKFSGDSKSRKGKKGPKSRHLDVSCSNGGGSPPSVADEYADVVSENWPPESAATIRTQKLEDPTSGGNALIADAVFLGFVLRRFGLRSWKTRPVVGTP
jgi:hypothetical protein